MADSGYGAGSEPLTAVECARLRPSVRVAALERWLVATGGEARRLVIAHFAQEVTPDDLRASHMELGGTDEELAELEEMLAEPLPSEEGPVHVPGPDAPPGALAFSVVPYGQLVVRFEPPDDPSLQAFWDAIEPADNG
jgi:hypothetical protein